MNGCISKAHSNLFIPSTLTGSNKTEKGLDEFGCFRLNGPFRNISVYIGPPPREREKEKRSER